MHVCIYDPVHQVPSENQLKIFWRVSQGRHFFNPMMSQALVSIGHGSVDQQNEEPEAQLEDSDDEPEAESKDSDDESEAESKDSDDESEAEPEDSGDEHEDGLTKDIERIQISSPRDSFGKQLKIIKLQKLRRIQNSRKFS